MRNILIIGAGRSASSLIQYLLNKSEANDKAVPKWLLVVAVLTLVVIIARSMMPDEVEQDAQFEQQKIESQQEDLKDLEGLE